MDFTQIRDEDLILDNLPDSVVATIEVRNAMFDRLAMDGSAGLEFLVDDLRKWVSGQTIRVAFLDGDSDLHRDIMMATQEITDACNIRLDFGETESGEFRRWTEGDTNYEAEIRVSFDKSGYFSLVGIDSIDTNIGNPSDSVGGRPSQASLNLGGFHVQRPSTWSGTTRHEFMHALGFHHAHQNMRGPCQASFRWDDDEGYVATTDGNGRFVVDADGKRPGIYTYLAGFPNSWNSAKVDHNLRTEEDPRLVAGPFDSASVMLYRFPELFYKSIPSPCAPVGSGQSLSEQDKRGLSLLYPHSAAEIAAQAEQQKKALEEVEKRDVKSGSTLEMSGNSGVSAISNIAAALKRKLDGV